MKIESDICVVVFNSGDTVSDEFDMGLVYCV